jgi:ABC-type amino acid transport substrate-binding protein
MRRVVSESTNGHRVRIASLAFAFLGAALLTAAQIAPASAATLDRVRETGKLTLGYRTDAHPFSYQDQPGAPAGYSVALCQKIADQVKADLGLPTLAVEWVPVTLADRFNDVKQGKIDLLCGADTATLTRMKDISFSISIFPGGIGAMLRADAPPPLQELLAEAPPPSHPVWRGSPARTFLEKKTFSVVAGTSSESWLAGRLKEFQIDAIVVPVASYEAGIQRVLNRSSDVLFGDRAILLEAAKRSSSEDLIVLDRLFTYEPLALGLKRGDDDFRLLVDRTLSQLFGSAELGKLYAKSFGKPEESALTFFRLSALPE